MTKKTNITLVAYLIHPAQSSTKSQKLYSEVLSVLEENKVDQTNNTIEDRFMSLSSNDHEKEGDFISYYDKQGRNLFGSFLRMKKGDIAQILKTQMHKPTLALDDITTKTQKKIAGAVKDYSYFWFNNKYLIYMPGKISLKSFQTYINWLIHKADEDKSYVFHPIINEIDSIPVNKIKSIDIADSAFQLSPGEMEAEYHSISKNIKDLKSDLLKFFFSDSKDLSDIDAENIVSAYIKLKIKSFRGKNAEEKKKALTAIMHSTDNEDITITTEDNKKIKGSSVALKKSVSIELTESGFPVEEQIKAEMKNFGKEVAKIKHEEVGN